ncbi:MAG TPA: tryptophan synthase subunit alpha [Burkholderiales bacterium]|nr:tryptophan synthase subunit alpha [Burkholderiales bacterium]
MSRIAATFSRLQQQKKKALIPFITAGDPEPGMTVKMMQTLSEGGADIIELGVPFSDPMADGPTIQRSYERALKHRISLKQILDMVAEFRKSNLHTPVVLMGYANPIETLGYEKFAEAAQVSGVDGVLVVDYPPQECVELVKHLERRGIDPIFLLSPTTTEARIEEVVKLSRGYLYYVSLKGVTGARHLDLSDVAKKLPQIRARTKLPVGVGFGIRDAQTAMAVAGLADAVVVGSRIVEEVEKSAKDQVLGKIAALIQDLRRAIDQPG